MSHAVTYLQGASASEFVVPGTCFAPPSQPDGTSRDTFSRAPVLRNLYLSSALAEIPRLLGAIDRNPYRPTYGCLDRQYWHYRTSSFPSQMYQEGVLPLALVYATKLPGNRWQGDARVGELAVAAIRFAAESSYRDGSCDDYYPFERSLGAAVFSLQSAARAYQVLELDDPQLVGWLERRCRWLMRHDESGRLANHQALAALGLLRVGEITGKQEYRDAAQQRVEKVLDWQNDEGWFEEYGGADPGYQTVTVDCLAKYRRLTGDSWLNEPLQRAVAFARQFLHPDGSYAGEYGSRGTYHFYPHGMELLAGADSEAADLADGFLRSLSSGKDASLSDDRMYAHRLGNLIEAYIDWSPTRRPPRQRSKSDSTRYFGNARLLVRCVDAGQTVISAARGGVFKHFGLSGAPVTDAGLIIETSRGRVAVSQSHDLTRRVDVVGCQNAKPPVSTAEVHTRVAGGGDKGDSSKAVSLKVDGRLHWVRFETATPIKQAVFHTGMSIVGRWCRTLVRRLLQRRLITGRRECPMRLKRVFEFLPDQEAMGGPGLRVTDTIELKHPRLRIRRMSYGTDHQAAYVAAGGVYQEGVLAPWTDLQPYIGQLNEKRCVTIVREL